MSNFETEKILFYMVEKKNLNNAACLAQCILFSKKISVTFFGLHVILLLFYFQFIH